MEFEAIIPDIRIRKCAVVRSLDWLCWLSLARCRVLIQLEIWNLESVSRVGANSDRVMWGGGVIRLLAQAPPHQTNWGPTCWSLYCALHCTPAQYWGQGCVSSDTANWGDSEESGEKEGKYEKILRELCKKVGQQDLQHADSSCLIVLRQYKALNMSHHVGATQPQSDFRMN